MGINWFGNSMLGTPLQVAENIIAVNQAAVSAWSPTRTDGQDAGDDENSKPSVIERIEPSADLSEWDAEGTASEPGELRVGDYFEFTKTITEADVERFAAATGDTNPLHLDENFAEETRFKGRITHGTLAGSLISAALARVPGLVVYLSQDLEFHNPVRIGDRLTAECEVVEDFDDDQYRLNTRVLNNEQVTIDGEAVILIDEPPKGET
jgi:acyl dehydratase